MIKRLFLLVITAVLFQSFIDPSSGQAQERTLVFAAASTNAPLTAAIQAFNDTRKAKIIASFAGSSTLAQQISLGAPADLYISANTRWVDFLEKRDLLVLNSRVGFLSNQLVLAGNRNRKKETPADLVDLPRWLGDKRIAVGDPDHVPAGIYAKAALKSLGLWQNLRSKIARQPNVASALAMVERNEVPYAIVYASDVRLSENVDIVAVFPENSHPKITYVLAVVKGAENKAAKEFYNFLLSGAGQRIFESFGFKTLKEN